jgi:hypothetical protein
MADTCYPINKRTTINIVIREQKYKYRARKI